MLVIATQHVLHDVWIEDRYELVIPMRVKELNDE